MEVEPVALGWVVLGKEPAECLRARVRRVDELHVNVVADGVGTVFLDWLVGEEHGGWARELRRVDEAGGRDGGFAGGDSDAAAVEVGLHCMAC